MIGRTAAGLVVAAVLSTGVAGCAHGGGHHTHIATENTPPAVLDGFHREFPGCTLAHTDEVHQPDGTVAYELKFHDAAHHYHRKIFSADGKLLDTRDNVETAH